MLITEPRTRTKQSIKTIAESHWWGKDFPAEGRSYFNDLVQTDVMVDRLTPNFWARRKAGEIIVNPMTHTITSIRESRPNVEQWVKSNPTVHGFWTNFPIMGCPLFGAPSYSAVHTEGSLMSQDTIDQLRSVVKNAATANIDKSTFAFAEDVAEGLKTIRSVKSWIELAKKLATQGSSSNRKRFVRFLRSPVRQAKAWLEVRYALRPILISIDNLRLAAEMIDKTQKNVFHKALSRQRKEGKYKYTADAHWDPNHTGTYCEETSWIVEVSCGIIYTQKNQGNKTLKKYGLRLRDIPKTAWALVPYSFVVDHFFNITKSIDAAISMANPDIQILNGWCTTTTVIQVSRIATDAFVTTSAYGGTVSCPHTITSRIHTVERVQWVPDLFTVFPPFNDRLDAAFKMDLAALVLVFINRKRPINGTRGNML